MILAIPRVRVLPNARFVMIRAPDRKQARKWKLSSAAMRRSIHRDPDTIR